MTQKSIKFKATAEALNDAYRVDELKALAGLVSPGVKGRKAELINAIVDRLSSDLAKIVKKLPAISLKALAETVHSWGGVYDAKRFAAKYSASPFNRNRKKYISVCLLDLFIIRGHVPKDLRKMLLEIVPKPSADAIRYSGEDALEGLTKRETAHASLANLETLLGLVRDRKIRVSPKTGRATAATSKKISAMLYDGDWYEEDEQIGPVQAFSWPLLLQGGGMATVDAGYLKLSRAGNKALTKDLPGGIKGIWKRWEKTAIIDEFSRVTAIKGQKSARGRTMTAPSKRRPLINAALESLEPGRWVDIDELSRFMLSEDLDFPMVNYDWKLYFGDPNYGNLSYFDTWSLVQIRYLLVYLFEYCATLGIVDVAYSSPEEARPDFRSCWGAEDLSYLSHCDGLQSIRLNNLGAFTMGLTDELGLDEHEQTFQFDGTDILYLGQGPVLPTTSLFLDKIADRVETSRWQITAASLFSAVKAGEQMKEIHAFLEEIALSSLDPELIKLMEEVAGSAASLVDAGRAQLIACSPEFRKRVSGRKDLAALCLPAGEKHIVVLPGKEKQFARKIESLGYIISKKS